MFPLENAPLRLQRTTAQEDLPSGNVFSQQTEYVAEVTLPSDAGGEDRETASRASGLSFLTVMFRALAAWSV